MIKGRKVSILGAGKVGATIAYTLAVQQIVSEIALIDVNRQKAEGEAMDIIQGARFIAPLKIYAGDYAATAGSEIVIHTLGMPRQPGMSRLDLVNTNVGIFRDVLKEVVPYTSESVHIVVSNPVDILTYAATKMSGLPAKRIIGSGTLLDTSRLRAILSELTHKSYVNIHAYVLAEHGDTSFIPWSMASLLGVKVTDYVEGTMGLKGQDWKAKVLEDVRLAGARIINNKGATHFAVSMSICEICKNVLGDSSTILPLSNMMTGQYGLQDVCLSLPFSVGAQGLGDCIVAKLTPDEEEALHKSAKSLQEVCNQLSL
ncbi:MAG: L-lactate dehydrogenase [Synergistaceae bacterium]|jgi:L-lactate dehydrogenase|nr:L-lactate dehydrogenase [Synergistaceae bacterium]